MFIFPRADAIMVLLLGVVTLTSTSCNAFVISMKPMSMCHAALGQGTRLFMSTPPGPEDDSVPDPEGADLAAQLFQMAQAKGVSLDAYDLLDEEEDDEEDEDDDDDEVEPNFPQGAINAFLGYDTGDVGERLAGNVSLTNDQLYSEVKERVLDTAGGFIDFVKGASDDDDEDEEEQSLANAPKEYVPPLTIPDSDLTAGEVVLLILEALKNNDNPTRNKGVEILFGYSSSGSQIRNEEGLTPAEYADFLKETEYKVLFTHEEVMIDKGQYSFDGKKAFFTARLRVGPAPLDFTSCNFILTSEGSGEDAAWMVDSILIRPESMRRRRRR